MKKIKVYTLGCRLNFAESSHILSSYLSAGYEEAKGDEEADLVIVNTCSVTDAADHKGRQLLHRIHREHPHAEIHVMGCYSELKPIEVSTLEGVTRIIPQAEKPLLTASSEGRTRCFLKVQDGCNYFCTYCTIPFARGRSRNAPIADIVELAQQAIADGAKELVLTGVNIGDFGRSTGESFFDLLKCLDSITPLLGGRGAFRYRIGSIEPNLLTPEMIAYIAHSQHIAPHFHIPLQSGSDTVLKLMHRHYDTALFRSRIEYIRELMPNAFIGVDIMTGVRGETDELFEEGYRFVESLPVSQLHVFTYSERPNTRMLQITPIIPQTERKRRSELLHQLSNQKLHAFYQSQLGHPATVLWESKRVLTKDAHQSSVMYGYTENYVRLQTPYDPLKINQFEHLTIHDLAPLPNEE